MNKVFKVIWNEARNAYVVVSEIAKNRGSKSCSTKKLLAMLIATGVMTCASFDVLAAEPMAAETAKSQYVAFGDTTPGLTNGKELEFDGHKYIYDAANKYWVREGYVLVVEENGKLHTPLSANGKSADVLYIGGGDTGSILQSVASTVSANGTVTNMGESLNRITASAFAGVSHGGGTAVAGDWSYIIQDSSWKDKDSVASGNYKDGYADLIDKDNGMPKGFKTAEDPNTELNWDATKQAYTYKGKPVDYSNVYVIDGKIGVFTNKDGSEVYKGTVFGKNNEILMTVKDANNKFYSYWASEVTDPSATMQSYRMTEYKKDLSVLEENDNKLHRDDIKEVTMTTDASTNSATIGLVRNGNTEAGAPVKGAITVTSGGGTDGQDTFVKISNDTANQTFATGSKVEAIVTNDATTGIKINGQEYTIKDTDTKYTAGENVVIDKNNNNKISVDLSQYAKTVDVAVVYNDKNSLHSTNSGNVGEKAIAFGQNAIADGKFSVAIGDSANVDANSVYTSSGAYSTAVGAASGAWGTQATAIGYNAQAKKQNAVALGFSASASATDSVAIGASSIANREAGSLGLYADGRTDSTWKATSGAVSIGQSGTTRQIINLAAGTADTDAVNVAQLKKVKAEADKHTTLVAGANVTLNKEETENGLKYTISATGTNYTAGNGIAIDATYNTISVKLQDGSNLEVSEQGLALKKQLTGMESIQGAGEGKISFEGANVKVNNTTFSENSVVVGGGTDGKTPVTINGTDGVVSGLHNTDIGYTDFATKGNAATEEQLKKVMDAGWKFTTDSGTQTTVTVGEAGNEVEFNGDDTNIEVTNTDKAIKVALKKDLTVDSVKAGDFFMDKNNGVGYKGKAYITSSGLNANNQKITGVAAGTIAAGSTDAVNGSQLNDVKKSISNDISNKTFGLEDDKGNKATSTLGNTVQVKGADGITSTVKDGALEIGLKLQDNSNLVVNSNGLALNTALIGIQSITGAGAGSISFNGGNVKVNQNTFNSDGRIQNVANGTETNDAVNFGQLKETNNKVDNLTTEVGKGWTVATENGTETKVGAGDTVKFSGADDNIKVSNTSKDVKVELNKALTGIESINGTGAGSISFADGVIKLNNKVTIDNTGKITGVADGVNNNDAVNVSQLNAVKETANKGWNLSTGKGEVVNVAPDATVDFSGDDNIKVSNNGKDVKVELNKALTGIESINGTGAGSISFADGVIKLNNKVNIDNTGKITGVAAGTIAAGSTDAVNGSQLYDLKVEAGKHSKVVGGNNINVEETDDNGQKIYKVNLNKNIILGDLTGKYVNISGTNGTIETTGSITTNDRVYADKGGKLANIDVTGDKLSNGASSIVMDGSNVKVNDKVTIDNTGKITGVADGVNNNDAVNVGQLNAAVQAGNTDTHIRPGEYGVGADNKVNMDVVDKNGTKINTVTITDVAKASDVGNVNNINNDLKNSNGTTTVVDAVNKLNQKLDNKVGDLNYVAGGAGTKGNYVTNGENTTVSIGKLDQALKDVAATAAKHTTVTQGDNITVTPGTNTDGSKNYNVALNKDITVESVTAGKANIGGVSIENNTVNNLSNKTWDAKNTDQYKDSGKAATEAQLQQAMSGTVQYDRKEDGSVNKTQITLNKEGDTYTTITNVANGKVEKDSKDAINGGQLFDTETKINNRIDGVENQVISNSNRIGQLSSRVNKVGAGAAALAALHPMDFDPDDKLTFSAGYGNYAGQNAAAIGAYYRPDEKVMFSVGGTVGNGENMVNAGISFALDRTNHVSNSRTAMAREILDLRAEVNELRAMVAKGNLGSIEEDKMKIFPDVAENHWAYEYIGKMAAAGMIEGYPDGSFGGDRMMTRYEFAAMLYRAMQKGAQLDSKIVNEFAPEMGRIRVDRISGEDGDRNKIERVRVNATKGERDHYGNKLK